MRLDGREVYIRPLERDDAGELLDLRVANRDFLEPWEPRRTEAFYSIEAHREEIAAGVGDAMRDRAHAFGVFESAGDRMVGRVSLSNISRGAWQSATIGYFIGRAFNGRGFATEAVRLTVDYAFRYLDLHRVQAAVMPCNEASLRILQKLGFEFEGLARRYLRINGKWEDHHIYSVTVEVWPGHSNVST